MADQFFRRFDELLGEYLDLGYVVGMVADHGMNDKHDCRTATPRVHYLEDVLAASWHQRLPRHPAHHRSLCRPPRRARLVRLGARPAGGRRAGPGGDRPPAEGVEEVFTREEAAVIYSHPTDRIGDLSVAADARTALGKSAAKHDLSVLAGPLRSHGGRHEQIVPIIVSHPLTPALCRPAPGRGREPRYPRPRAEWSC